MDKDDSILVGIKSDRQTRKFVGLLILAILVATDIPIVIFRFPSDWQDFSGLAVWVYAVVTLFTLAALVYTVWIALQQVDQLNMNLKFSLIQEVYKSYREEEMGEAIRAVWNYPPERFQPNTKEDNQRRVVSDFWNWLGWLHSNGIASLDIIDSRFQDGVKICDTLAKLELSLRLKIERQRHDKWNDEQWMYAATDHVANLPLVKLYNKWSNKYGLKYNKEYSVPEHGAVFKDRVQNAKKLEELDNIVQASSILPAQFRQLVTYHMERLKRDPFRLGPGELENEIGNAYGIADRLKELVGIKELREEELPLTLRNELEGYKTSSAEKGVGFRVKKIHSGGGRYLITTERWFGAGTGLQYVEEQEIKVTLDEDNRIKEKLQSQSIDRMEIGDSRI